MGWDENAAAPSSSARRKRARLPLLPGARSAAAGDQSALAAELRRACRNCPTPKRRASSRSRGWSRGKLAPAEERPVAEYYEAVLRLCRQAWGPRLPPTG